MVFGVFEFKSRRKQQSKNKIKDQPFYVSGAQVYLTYKTESLTERTYGIYGIDKGTGKVNFKVQWAMVDRWTLF